MSLRLKRQYTELLKSLKEALQYIKSEIRDDALEILAECQNLVITTGTGLEILEADQKVVCIMEDIAELLYKIACLYNQEFEQSLLLFQEIDFLIQTVDTFIEKDKKFRREVLFLPYKASMWDCMHSVYLAAKEDPNWNVTVMPIPYYGLNSHQQRDQEYYEGTIFPADIEVVDYKKYSMKARLPDVIIIHNIYDGYNTITSVHPDYYSKKLREITENVVYIPYFVLEDRNIHKDYYLLPGIMRMWRIFVQSQKVKNILRQYMDEKKIIVLESPKEDMLKLKTGDVPAVWKDVIKEKKVFLYNTHLVTAMQHVEYNLQQITNTLSIFKERKDVVLLWRPHPLMNEALRAFCPKFFQKYVKNVELAQKIPNIIFDDTSDLYRSIQISDAYIGDGSSVVELYKRTKKPIWLRAGGTPVESHISTMSVTEDRGMTWIFSNTCNALFKMDVVSHEIEYVTSFFEEDSASIYLFKDIISHNNCLYFVPNIKNYIISYNKDTGTVVKHTISNPDREVHYEAIKVDQLLWLIPCDREVPVSIFDFKTGKAEKSNLLSKVFKHCKAEDGQTILGKPIYENYTIWIPVRVKNAVVSINVKARTCRLHILPNGSGGFRSGRILENEYWLLAQWGDVITRWNMVTGECTLIGNWPKEFKVWGKSVFYNIHIDQNKVWILPQQSNCVICMNKDGGDIKMFPYLSLGVTVSEQQDVHAFVKHTVVGQTLYLWPMGSDKALIIDLELAKVEAFEVVYPSRWKNLFLEQYLKHYYFQNMKKNPVYLSEKVCDMEMFIDMTLAMDDENKNAPLFEQADKSLIGYQIWKEIAEKLKE